MCANTKVIRATPVNAIRYFFKQRGNVSSGAKTHREALFPWVRTAHANCGKTSIRCQREGS